MLRFCYIPAIPPEARLSLFSKFLIPDNRRVRKAKLSKQVPVNDQLMG